MILRVREIEKPTALLRRPINTIRGADHLSMMLSHLLSTPTGAVAVANPTYVRLLSQWGHPRPLLPARHRHHPQPSPARRAAPVNSCYSGNPINSSPFCLNVAFGALAHSHGWHRLQIW
jgi:hypothetical protein